MNHNALPPLAQPLLQVLHALVAVLDARGSIVAVNEAWRHFAAANAGWADEAARAMYEGVGPLLRGERNLVTVEYSCQCAAEQRWFAARVTRFTQDAATYLAAVSEDVTARKAAEDALHETQALLRRANAEIDRMGRDLQQGLVREQARTRTDDLTGLYNRRHFFELSAQLFAVAKRYGMPFSILMLDVDHLKRINERLGQQAGDAILRCVGKVAREHTRGADVFARYGGEEFIAALPNTNARGGEVVVEHLRAKVAACREVAGAAGEVTISVGIAEMAPGDATLEAVIRRADEALHNAQKAAR